RRRNTIGQKPDSHQLPTDTCSGNARELEGRRGWAFRWPSEVFVPPWAPGTPGTVDFSGVESHANREAQPSRSLQLLGIAPELILEMECCVAGSPGMVLKRDGRSEKGHDAFAGVLIHCPFKAVNSLGEDREEAIHDPVPVLGVDRLREIH